VKVVGDELHPLARVKDFAPVHREDQASARIRDHGNWGTDLSLLVKAAKDANLKADFYTYYAGTVGVPQANGRGGVGPREGGELLDSNGMNAAASAVMDAYKKKYGADQDPYSQSIRISLEFVARRWRR
jgi:branched-chain amino acid transport system substrate-binding protein